MLDFETINQYALATYPGILEEWLPGGKLSGYEYRCGDLSGGAGDSLGVNIKTGKWADFAAEASGGDPISLYAAIRGIGQGEAARELSDRFGVQETPAPKPAATAKKPKWQPLVPVPSDAPQATAADFKHYKHGDPAAVWTYRTAAGEAIGHICRYDTSDGKEIIPLVYADNGKSRKWRNISFPKPRPLYGLDRLAARPDSSVIVVEGEKCADALQSCLDAASMTFVVVSWPGGSKAVKYADFSPLAGRKIVLWPDFDEKKYKNNHPRAGQVMDVVDQPGMAAMLNVVHDIGDAAQCRIMTYDPGEKPDGWDCADAIADGWGAAQCIAFLKSRLCDPAELTEDDQPPLPDEPPAQHDSDSVPLVDDDPSDRWTLDGAPFQVLGYDHGGYFYLPRGTRQVVELTAAGHTGQNLTALAPLQWWEKKFPGKQGVNWNSAANACLRTSEHRGVYDPGRIRGRGAWEDDGRSVLHVGDRLIVDGQACTSGDIASDYIYEAAAPLDQGVDAEPLSTRQANRFAALCDMPTWESGISGRLMAGWCVVAPICGALSWRPHIWVTGGAGSGKSWVMDNILRPAIGPAALCVQSNTTEAGLRQLLKYDARPVLFDEAEGEDRESQTRIQKVLELMRQASSETGAAIVKGSSGGKAQLFRIRSMFAFSSIGVGATQKADNSRLTVLTLQRNESPDRVEQFEFIKRTRHELMTPEYLAGLRARTVRLIPVIRRNASTFARAAAAHLGSQRAGDQVGALLAGAYSLYSASEISSADAETWVQSQDWGEAIEYDGTTDESRCLSVILEAVIRVDTGRGFVEMSVGEAVTGTRSSADVTSKAVDAALERNGLKHDQEFERLIVSNTHSGVARILKDTPWSKNWARILARLPGAEKTGAMRFAGSAARGVAVVVDNDGN